MTTSPLGLYDQKRIKSYNKQNPNRTIEEGAAGEGHRPVSPGTRRPSRSRAILKVPAKVVRDALGLAIFTSARAGFQVSAATGSGVLIARQADGSWGAPSGIQVHALGAGFLAGADIYDCVCVINTREALEAFSRTRVSLGPEVALAAGPFGVGGKVQVGASASRSPEGGEAAGSGDKSKLSAERPAAERRRSSYNAFGPVFTSSPARTSPRARPLTYGPWPRGPSTTP
ncbi:hypothetical protein VUR80DRAFT_958 [Thermomyces stellatus]